MKSRLSALYGLLVLAGCSQQAPSEKPSESPPPYNVNFPMKEVMGDIIDPASQVLWHSSGTIYSEKGAESLTPTTEEGWLAADNAMTTVAEAGNLLMLPGRARDNGDWMKLSKQLTDAALEAKAAVLAKDETAMFDAGGKLYEVCTACHEKYLLPFLGPNGLPWKRGPNGEANPLLEGDKEATK
jgi:hypothetical protein